MSKRMTNQTVLIAVIGNVGNEPEALRQALESFGFSVVMNWIGRPRDLTDLLEGLFPIPFDYLIFSCHGENGAIIMPALDERIYFPNEHRGNFPAAEIARSMKLAGKTIINSGCTTGSKEMCNVFSQNNVYIAPNDYVEGNAAVFFIIHLFYELAKGKPLCESFEQTRKTDEETQLFHLSDRK